MNDKIKNLLEEKIVTEDLLNRKLELGFSTDGVQTYTGNWKNIQATVAELLETLLEWEIGDKDGTALLQGNCIKGVRKAPAMQTMYTIMFDCDTGEDIDLVKKNLESIGAFAVIWTTHSHLTEESSFPFDGLMKHAKNPDTLQKSHVTDFLIKVKHWKKEIAESIKLKKTYQNERGIQQLIKHAPIPKYRILMVLEKPFTFANRGTTHANAIKEWKGRYIALGNKLDLDFDSSCTDPSRLMYTPRVSKKEDYHFIEIVSGNALNLENFAPVEVRGKHSSSRHNRKNRASSQRIIASNDYYDIDIIKWVQATHGAFLLAEVIRHEAEDQIVRDVEEDKIDMICPFHENHTKGVEMGFFVTNGFSKDEQFNTHCMHDSCQGIDRLLFLKELIANDVVPIESLVDPDYFHETNEESIKWKNVQKLLKGANGKHYGQHNKRDVLDNDRITGTCTDRSKPSGTGNKSSSGQHERVSEGDTSELDNNSSTDTEDHAQPSSSSTFSEAPGRELRELIDYFANNITDTSAMEELVDALASERNEIYVARLVTEINAKTRCGKTTLNTMIKRRRSEIRQEQRLEEREEASIDIEWVPHPEDPYSYVGPIYAHWDFDIKMEVLIAALQRSNDVCERLFYGPAGEAVRVEDNGDHTKMQVLKENAWLAEVHNIISFVKINGTTGEHNVVPPFPECIKTLIGQSTLPLPALKGITRTPIYGKDGQLHTSHGYKESTESYLISAFDITEAPKKPKKKDINKSLYYLLHNALTDFPFSDGFSGFNDKDIKSNKNDIDGWPLPNFDRGAGSRAHALSMIIEPFVRPIINGPTPLYHVDKSAPGTGAGYLANVASFIFNGHSMPAQIVSKDEAEMRKALSATLRFPQPYLFLDNVNHYVDSGAFASALTTGIWRDRLLATSEMVTLPVSHTWIIAGNNVSFSDELVRRIIPIRMDAKLKDPSLDRSEANFKRFPLAGWLEDNRKELIWSVHVLINNWINNHKGKEYSGTPLNSFEDWSKVMGGILESAGVNGFLSNLESYRNVSRDTDDTLTNVAQQIFDLIGLKERLTSREIFDTFNDEMGNFLFISELGIKDKRPTLTMVARRINKMLVGKTFRLEKKAKQKNEKMHHKINVKFSQKKTQVSALYGFFEL